MLNFNSQNNDVNYLLHLVILILKLFDKQETLEKKKAKYIEKMKNKVALLHKTAEEKRANTEAKRGEDVLKAEELAAKCRATGATPKKLLRWFSK